MEEEVFWADKVAEMLSKKNLSKYVVQDEYTPSGRAHIGSLRGWIIHNIVNEALKDKGLNSVFLLGADDGDPLDTIPTYFKGRVSEEHLGKPLYAVPSPIDKYSSYSEAIFSEVKDALDCLGIQPTYYSTSSKYREGVFDEGLKIALDSAKKINEINERISGAKKPEDYLPVVPTCRNCGRMMTTYAFDWNGSTLKYVCRKDAKPFAGCGYEEEISPFKGGVKAVWKVEWCLKWLAFNVTAEYAGKDHYTKGGSREVSEAIYREVFGKEPPYGEGYEFVLMGKEKMSKSSGVGLSAKDIVSTVEPLLIKFLFTKTRPRLQVPFDLNTDLLPHLYDEYDRFERIYFGKEAIENQERLLQIKRVYCLSQTKEVPKQLPVQVPFSFCVALVQIARGREFEALKKTGHVQQNISKEDEERIKKRLLTARKWVEKNAPEQWKILLLTDLPSVDFSPEVSEIFFEATEKIKKGIDGEKLQEFFHKKAKEKNIPIGELCSAAYKLFLGKERGPRLGPFLVSLEKSFVIRRLRREA